MEPTDVRTAIAAALSTTSALGLRANDATILQNANRLVLRLSPCDVVARVAPVAHQPNAAFEVEVARRLGSVDAPIALLEPRVEPQVYLRDGFAVTLWVAYDQAHTRELTPREYAHALERLHTAMRTIDLATPRFTDRVAEAQQLVESHEASPELGDADRALLSSTLRDLQSAILQRAPREQLLHGEPHPGNLLVTSHGLLFTDFQTCCRGPVEFDIAHCSRRNVTDHATPWQPDVQTPLTVGEQYAHADRELVRACWLLSLAMVAAWRWDRHDQFPDGRRMGTVLLDTIRAAMRDDRPAGRG